MSAHTPGPWVAVMGGPNQYSIRTDGTEDGLHHVALVASRQGHPARANAKMLAAAPDLAKALEDLVPDGRALFGRGVAVDQLADDEVCTLTVLGAELKAARAAIKKARGAA